MKGTGKGVWKSWVWRVEEGGEGRQRVKKVGQEQG